MRPCLSRLLVALCCLALLFLPLAGCQAPAVGGAVPGSSEAGAPGPGGAENEPAGQATPAVGNAEPSQSVGEAPGPGAAPAVGGAEPGSSEAGADQPGTAENQAAGSSTSAVGPLIPCDFYNEAEFARSVAAAQLYPVEGPLRAGTVPHHLLAGSMIASFFATAAQSGEYDAVLFVATMHYPGQDAVITASQGFATPFGPALPEEEFTRQLLADPVLAPLVDNAMVQQDHAVAGLIPYAKYYLPTAKVGLCQIANSAAPQRQEALARLLLEYTGTHRCLVVCSVDFSHHLMPEEAALRDVQTARAIEEFDYGAIAGMGDNNMDSPYTVSTFLRLAEDHTLALLEHGSAEQFLALPLDHPQFADGATTYFVYGVS